MKTAKKLLFGILIFMLLTVLPMSFQAAAETEGYYVYEIANDAATITGSDKSISGDIVIPDTLGGYPVTQLAKEAFAYRSNITSITIPDTVTSIGDYAFLDCENLKSVEIPDSVTSLGEGVFQSCEKLESIKIGSGLRHGFSSYTDLDYCYSLEKIIVDENNQYYSNDEHGVLFNKEKTRIIYYPYANKNTEYVIPDSVTAIKSYGGESDFDSKYLKTLVIGSNVAIIEYDAFYKSLNLESIKVKEDNQYFSSDENGVLFNKDKTSLLRYPCANQSTQYIVPESVKKIGYYDGRAFENSDNLISVIIPEGVEFIGGFDECDNLASVSIPSSVIEIGSCAFQNSYRLKNVTIPDGVTKISANTFYSCKSLEYIAIPDSVTEIEKFAFDYCGNLKSIAIPKSVTTIGYHAFDYCVSLTDVYYGSESENDWLSISISEGNSYLTDATIHYAGEIEEPETDQEPEQDNSFLGKIKAFFQKIIDWFKNLFK